MCKKSLFSFLLILSFICLPSFSQKQEEQTSFRIKVINLDFSQGKDNWSVFGRTSSAINFSVENKIAHVVYTSDKDWAVSNKTYLNVKQGEVYRISCTAKNNKPISSSRLCVVCLNQKKVLDYHMAQTDDFSNSEWKAYSKTFAIYSGIDSIYLRLNGSDDTDILVKDITIEQLPSTSITPATIRNPNFFENGKFTSKKYMAETDSTSDDSQLSPSAKFPEKLDRGLSIRAISDSSILLSWRLLASDSDSVSFTVEKERNGKSKVITKKPIKDATCFVDNDAVIGDIYTVSANTTKNERSLTNNRSSISKNKADLTNSINLTTDDSAKIVYSYHSTYLSIPLINKSGAEKVAVADLDGDGSYDFIAKTPAGNIDPASQYHIPSKTPYSLEAYKSDGTFLWQKNLGWNIETGTWYSPYIAADLDGDGKAEIIVKTGDDTSNGRKDWRDSEGRVNAGPEYLSVLDGMSGKELARTDWIPREGFEEYNRAARNQIALAYFDKADEKGRRTPCILMLRGTYGLMKVQALMYTPSKKQLVPVWSYSNEFLPPNTRGQGAHYTICTDIDNDGRDEVVLGSIVLDDDGSILWTTGCGHPDGVYFGNILPSHPGNEIAYFYETKQTKGGICLVDALTGIKIWELPYPTLHVHSRALCADIDSAYPGRELYGQDSIDHKYDGKRWLLASDGTVLKDATTLDAEKNKWGFDPTPVYWTDTPQKSIFDKNLVNYSGKIIMSADLLGDWREEVVTSTNDELRIYLTPTPSKNRRTCLMQKNEYRSIVTMDSNAYLQAPDLIEPVIKGKK